MKNILAGLSLLPLLYALVTGMLVFPNQVFNQVEYKAGFCLYSNIFNLKFKNTNIH